MSSGCFRMSSDRQWGNPEGFSWRKEEIQSGVERALGHLGTYPMIADLDGDDD